MRDACDVREACDVRDPIQTLSACAYYSAWGTAFQLPSSVAQGALNSQLPSSVHSAWKHMETSARVKASSCVSQPDERYQSAGCRVAGASVRWPSDGASEEGRPSDDASEDGVSTSSARISNPEIPDQSRGRELSGATVDIPALPGSFPALRLARPVSSQSSSLDVSPVSASQTGTSATPATGSAQLPRPSLICECSTASSASMPTLPTSAIPATLATRSKCGQTWRRSRFGARGRRDTTRDQEGFRGALLVDCVPSHADLLISCWPTADYSCRLTAYRLRIDYSLVAG